MVCAASHASPYYYSPHSYYNEGSKSMETRTPSHSANHAADFVVCSSPVAFMLVEGRMWVLNVLNNIAFFGAGFQTEASAGLRV